MYLPKVGDIVSLLMVSSLFLSISSVLMLYISFLLFEVALKPILLCAMFLVVYSVYSLNRLTDQEEDAVNAPERSVFVKGNERFLLAVAIASYILALALGWIENPFAALILIFPLITGIAYSKNIFSVVGIPRLKDIFLVKSLAVASSWAVCAAFLPVLYLSGDFIKLGFIFPFFFIKNVYQYRTVRCQGCEGRHSEWYKDDSGSYRYKNNKTSVIDPPVIACVMAGIIFRYIQ